MLRLAFRPPYDLDHLLAFLAARALPGVERVDVEGYARTVAVADGAAVVSVGRPPVAGEDERPARSPTRSSCGSTARRPRRCSG